MKILYSTFMIFFYLCGAAWAGPVPGLFEQNADDVMLDISRRATSVSPAEMTFTCHFISVRGDTQKFCITDPMQGRGVQVAVRESMSFVKAASIVTARDADDMLAARTLDTVFLSLAFIDTKTPDIAVAKARMIRNEVRDRLRREQTFQIQSEHYAINVYPKPDGLHIDIAGQSF